MSDTDHASATWAALATKRTPGPGPHGPAAAPHITAAAGWTTTPQWTAAHHPTTPPQSRAGRSVEQVLAVAFALAWIACPAVEPMPTGDMHYPLWQLPIDLATIGSIIAAVISLWRGHRHAARLGMAAGVMMAIMTATCPLAGHTPVGWWTWVQTALSLFVMGASAALAAHRRGHTGG